MCCAPDRDLMDAGDERGATGRADSGGREDVRIPDPLGRERIEVGRHRNRVAERADAGAQILGDEEQDVGPLARGCGTGEQAPEHDAEGSSKHAGRILFRRRSA